MGTVKLYRCPGCGYEEQLFPGCGMGAKNMNIVKNLVPEDILSGFDKNGDFLIGNLGAVCTRCKKLLTVADFTYDCGGGKKRYIAPCPDCGGEVVPIGSGAVKCPRCGSEMSAENVGHWD